MVQLETIGIVVVLIGLLVDAIGASLLFAPDLPEGKIKNWISNRFSRVVHLQTARERLTHHQSLDYQNQPDVMNAVYPVLCREFDFDPNEEPNEIARPHKAIVVESRSGVKQRRVNIENIDFLLNSAIRRGEERYLVRIGAVILVIGFVLQAFGSAVQLI